MLLAAQALLAAFQPAAAGRCLIPAHASAAVPLPADTACPRSLPGLCTRLPQTLRIDQAGKTRRVYVRRRDLIRAHGLQPRDLRRVDPSLRCGAAARGRAGGHAGAQAAPHSACPAGSFCSCNPSCCKCRQSSLDCNSRLVPARPTPSNPPTPPHPLQPHQGVPQRDDQGGVRAAQHRGGARCGHRGQVPAVRAQLPLLPQVPGNCDAQDPGGRWGPAPGWRAHVAWGGGERGRGLRPVCRLGGWAMAPPRP